MKPSSLLWLENRTLNTKLNRHGVTQMSEDPTLADAINLSDLAAHPAEALAALQLRGHQPREEAAY